MSLALVDLCRLGDGKLAERLSAVNVEPRVRVRGSAMRWSAACPAGGGVAAVEGSDADREDEVERLLALVQGEVFDGHLACAQPA